MNSNNPLSAIISRLREKKIDPSARTWITFSSAVEEIKLAFGLEYEPAVMMLCGLCATGGIACRDKQDRLIEGCPMGEFWSSDEFHPASVEEEGFREWIRAHSSAPQRSAVEPEIVRRLRNGDIPGRNIKWKPFCDEVRHAPTCVEGVLPTAGIGQLRTPSNHAHPIRGGTDTPCICPHLGTSSS